MYNLKDIYTNNQSVKDVKQKNKQETQQDKVSPLNSVGAPTDRFASTQHQGNPEPDWNTLLRNAQGQSDEWRITQAKQVWEQEKQAKLAQLRQQERQNQIEAVLALPQHQRTKDFYDKMSKEQGAVYWHPTIQRQIKTDRQALGLAFHLKGGK